MYIEFLEIAYLKQIEGLNFICRSRHQSWRFKTLYKEKEILKTFFKKNYSRYADVAVAAKKCAAVHFKKGTSGLLIVK